MGLQPADTMLVSDEIVQQFDSTGMFHYCSPRPIEDCLIVSPLLGLNPHSTYFDLSLSICRTTSPKMNPQQIKHLGQNYNQFVAEQNIGSD